MLVMELNHMPQLQALTSNTPTPRATRKASNQPKVAAALPETESQKFYRTKGDEARKKLAIAIEQMDDSAIIKLADLCKVVEADEGNSLTPVESFIVELGCSYVGALERGRGLTPDDIERDFEDFREWFDDAVQITRKFRAEYADAIDNPAHEKVA
jgi:hypothetical protein